jgi:hypothetical protein
MNVGVQLHKEDKPSTGPIGNAALMRAVTSLSNAYVEQGQAAIRAYCFMGKRVKGSKTQVQITRYTPRDGGHTHIYTHTKSPELPV